MADNSAQNGTDSIATDELTTLNGGAVSGFKAQRVKVGFGSDGVFRDVDAANPLPGNVTDGTNIAGVSTTNELFVSHKDLVSSAANITVADSGSSTATGSNNQSLITGTPTANSVVAVPVTGDSSFAVQITGTWTGTLQFERSLDNGATYTSIGAFSAGTNFIGQTTTQNGTFHGNSSSATNIRVRATSAITGTAVVRILAGAGTGTITIGNPIRLFDAVNNLIASISAKNTQGAAGLAVQDLKDAGRNPVHYYMLIPVLTSATDTLQSLTVTKSGATVAATTTPAVVTTGKTLRVTRLAATYIATATSGYGLVRLRFNTAGVVAITSPVAATLAVGSSAPVTANATGTVEAAMDEGIEFAAGTGIGISVQGFAAVTATAVGYVLASVTGYEY